MSRVDVCGVQFVPEWSRPVENAGRIAAEIQAGAAEGADLVVLPEASLTGYVFESRAECRAAAVEANGPELSELASACHDSGVWAVCGAIERADDRLFNTAFVIGPDGPLGAYRKVHTLCLGADRFISPGEDGFPVFALPFARIGVHICYDGSFPEPARALRVLGAQLLLLPTNWPDLTLKTELVRVRAYENHAYYFSVNRTGTERGARFAGGSAAAGPMGELLMEAGEEPGRYHVEIDPLSADRTRVVVTPGEYEYDRVVDRRPEAYGPLVADLVDPDRTGSRRA